MKLAAILLARALAFVETYDLNPRGKVFYPELVQEIVKRYNFQKYPQNLEDFDESKGVVFVEGKMGDIVIEKFTIFDALLALETRSNTNDSQRIILDMLQWGQQKFGLTFEQ